MCEKEGNRDGIKERMEKGVRGDIYFPNPPFRRGESILITFSRITKTLTEKLFLQSKKCLFQFTINRMEEEI